MQQIRTLIPKTLSDCNGLLKDPDIIHTITSICRKEEEKQLNSTRRIRFYHHFQTEYEDFELEILSNISFYKHK